MITQLNSQSSIDEVREALARRGLPAYMAHGLWLYLSEGILGGDFLSALLHADYKEMLATADNQNSQLLHTWGVFLYNDIPALAWGSATVVRAWQERFTKKEV